jgi:hypothetical protein
MPYITSDARQRLSDVTGENLNFGVSSPDNAGELNYVFTCIALRYLNEKGKKYQHINDIIGALEGCKLELYRRVAAPYEDTKIRENGDVYFD